MQYNRMLPFFWIEGLNFNLTLSYNFRCFAVKYLKTRDKEFALEMSFNILLQNAIIQRLNCALGQRFSETIYVRTTLRNPW